MPALRSNAERDAMGARRIWSTRETSTALSYYQESTLRALAACDGHEDLFTMDRGKPLKAAKALCASCPVRNECLESALSVDWEPYGIWGGLSGAELRSKWQERRSMMREVA